MQFGNNGQAQQLPMTELGKNREVIARLAKSGEAQRLMAMLQQQGSVQRAAQSAAAGDASGLVEMVSRLMQTEEGAQLVEKIGEQAQKVGLK